VPRKGHVPTREVLPDPVYHDVKVAKLINNIMQDGKKGVAQKICYSAFDIVKERTGQDRLEFSPKPSRTSCRCWKSKPGASAVPITRCRSKSVRNAARPSACAGWLPSPEIAVSAPCTSASLTRSLTRSIAPEAPTRKKKTCIVWLTPIARCPLQMVTGSGKGAYCA